MISTVEKIYTFEEYLELEKIAEIRHEFVNGKLISMPEETKKANLIAGNLYLIFRANLDDKHLASYFQDVRLEVENGRRYRYPDVVIAPSADDEDELAVKLPVIIVEVLSKSTASIDTNEKLEEYIKIPSLSHYLIVAQDKVSVQVYSRDKVFWQFKTYNSKEEMIILKDLSLEIEVKEIYKKIKF